ncbi:MAG TPA: VWA domain-containing protein [Vicinamibacterales bacterium]
MIRTRLRARATFAGLGLLVATAWLGAQQTPQFRAATDFVFRDVRVLDAGGRAVLDLRREEFRVFEDGVEQRIEWFVRSVGDAILTEDRPEASRTEGLILPKKADDRSGRILVIFIDDLHVYALDSIKTRKVLETLRDEVIKPNDWIAIVSTGYSSIATNLTLDPDHTRFNAALRKVMGSAQSPSQVIAAPTTSQGPVGLQFNAHVAFQTAYSLLEQLEKIPGRRKAFFYVSHGYDFNPFESSRLKAEMDRWSVPGQDAAPNPFETKGQQFSDADLARELGELTRAANRANTVFYPIDPRGLVGGPAIDANVSAAEWWQHVSTGINSLRVLAGETNGRAIVNTNGFAEAFRRINADLSDYYVIGYYSSNRDPSHRTRQVQITVTRPDVRLEYQTRYTIRP